MRLSDEHVKAAILHSDQDVRSVALRYFAESFSRDPGVMPLVIEAIERWGWEEAFEYNSFMKNLVQTDQSVRWLIERIEANQSADPDDESAHRHALASALIHADVTILARLEFAVLNLDGLEDEAKKEIVQRISLLSESPKELWQQLEDICHRSDGTNLIPDHFDFACDLVEALGRHADSSTSQVLPVLSDESNELGKWLEVFAVRLAGELRLQEAVPRMVALLKEADDWIYEEGERALIKIGGDAVVEQIGAACSTGDLDLRIVGAAILRNIHSDLSVATALRLADSEGHQFAKNLLIRSALTSFSTSAIEPARQHVLAVPLDPEVIEVRNDLLTACKLLDETFPEFDAWMEDKKHDQEFRKKWSEDKLQSSILQLVERQLAKKQWEAASPPSPPPPAPILRDQERVGRNDPCPCGSGKKFKRCCLKEHRPVS